MSAGLFQSSLWDDIALIHCPRGGRAWTVRAGKVTADDVAIIVYTSGTTGPPKGALLTQANLTAAAEAFGQVFGVRPDDEVIVIRHDAKRQQRQLDPLLRFSNHAEKCKVIRFTIKQSKPPCASIHDMEDDS